MWDAQALRQKHEELKRRRRQVVERQRRIGLARPAADMMEQIRLDDEFERTKLELRDIEIKERRLWQEQLSRSLSYINYGRQCLSFHGVLRQHRSGAFWLHGAADVSGGFPYSLSSLLHRLLHELPQSATIQIKFPLADRRARQNDVPALWRQLGTRFGAKEKEEIARRVAEQLQIGHVILLFEDIDAHSQDYAHLILKDFWHPLVTHVQQLRSANDDFLLLAFFVDYTGQTTTWKIELHDLFIDGKTTAPVRFPVVHKFSSGDLNNWLQSHYVTFPEDLQARIDIGLDSIVQDILQASEDGVPDRVIEYLCGICDFEMEDIEEWLRI